MEQENNQLLQKNTDSSEESSLIKNSITTIIAFKKYVQIFVTPAPFFSFAEENKQSKEFTRKLFKYCIDLISQLTSPNTSADKVFQTIKDLDSIKKNSDYNLLDLRVQSELDKTIQKLFNLIVTSSFISCKDIAAYLFPHMDIKIVKKVIITKKIQETQSVRHAKLMEIKNVLDSKKLLIRETKKAIETSLSDSTFKAFEDLEKNIEALKSALIELEKKYTEQTKTIKLPFSETRGTWYQVTPGSVNPRNIKEMDFTEIGNLTKEINKKNIQLFELQKELASQYECKISIITFKSELDKLTRMEAIILEIDRLFKDFCKPFPESMDNKKLDVEACLNLLRLLEIDEQEIQNLKLLFEEIITSFRPQITDEEIKALAGVSNVGLKKV